jgi:hypothetical protein
VSKCECGSGKETSAHYFSGKLIAVDCPDCWKNNDDEYAKSIGLKKGKTDE